LALLAQNYRFLLTQALSEKSTVIGAASTNSADLKNFAKVLEQRKHKGVPRQNRRHFPRPLDPAAWFRTLFLKLT
jgi:hypothetical protein